MILTQYAIKFRVTVFALLAVLLLAGPVVYLALPREGAPDVTIPFVFVTAPYEGVAPTEIENLVTVPLEKQFNNLENVRRLSSASAEGVSLVVIEFTPRQKIDDAVQKVKEKIDLARQDLPHDLDEPTVQGLNLSTDIPVLNYAIAGDSDLERLRTAAEDLQDVIETVPGVLQARLYGTREREIRVEVDLQRLMAHALTLGELTAALRSENSTVSAGNLEISGDRVQVRIPGEFKDVQEIRDLLIRKPDGGTIRLSEVADVLDTYKDLTSISRLNGKPCVIVAVHKRAGENAHGLIRRIKKLVAANPLPAGLKATIVNDHSEWIGMLIEDLENSVFSGFLLVVIVLFIFMGLRNSVLVGLAIPFSLMIGFLVLAVFGMTLNMMVLFSLVLTVGMLVDNAIVIVENIFRRHSDGESRIAASLHGAAEVAWPVTTSTLTTLAAFLPLLFWPGIMGQFMGFLPRTVIIMLSASLFVALVINPAVCSIFVTRPRVPDSIEEPSRWRRFMNAYERLLRGALRHRALTLLVGVAFMAFTVATFARFGRGVELFPETEPRRATIQVRYPEGADIATTDATLKAMEARLGRYRDIRFFLTNVGSGGEWTLSAAGGTHLGSIVVECFPRNERVGSTIELVREIRAGIGRCPGCEVKVEQEEEGPPTGAAVSVEVSGEDFGVLADLADAVMRRIKDVPGLVDVQQTMEQARPELQFHVDRQRAALLGLDTDSVGRFLRTAVNGEQASKFRAGEDEYDITVRLRPDQRQSVDLLKQVAIVTPLGGRVPLASLGGFSYEGGRGQISRKGQKRVITITGSNQGRGVDKILQDVRQRVAGITLPKGYAIAYTGDTEEMNEAGRFLSKAFAIALALIALILVMEFNSVVQPVMILVSVLLSMAGVIWSLLIHDMRFSVIMTGIGVISLAGVVVNNGIVLIDCINQRRAQGMPTPDAVVTGGRLRLRPVLLTAITTAVGLLPMALGWGLDIHAWPPVVVRSTEIGDMWKPMALAVMYGLLLATMLTLVQVPVMYSLTATIVEGLKRRFGRRLSE